jgi:mono/diheme cytochrome c family protein
MTFPREPTMNVRTRVAVLLLVAITGVRPALAQTSDRSPSSSSELVAKGDALFHGSANCYACHGSKGEGLVGPNLTDAEWIHSKGSYDEIVAQINKGVPKEEAKSGILMPPKGGATLSDDDVKAIAAYVYSLSHK